MSTEAVCRARWINWKWTFLHVKMSISNLFSGPFILLPWTCKYVQYCWWKHLYCTTVIRKHYPIAPCTLTLWGLRWFGALERFWHVLIFVLISAAYNILMTNMYLFLYSAQTLLQYYVTKMDVHVCIFLEKKYYAWLVSFGKKNVAEIRP